MQAATAPFMSYAPRPNTRPSRTAAENGSGIAPTPTVSTWAFSISERPPPRPGNVPTTLVRPGSGSIRDTASPSVASVRHVLRDLGLTRRGRVQHRIHRVDANEIAQRLRDELPVHGNEPGCRHRIHLMGPALPASRKPPGGAVAGRQRRTADGVLDREVGQAIHEPLQLRPPAAPHRPEERSREDV